MRMPWFRFYTEALDDPKVQKLTGDLFKVWVNLLCLANEAEDRGTLPSREDIAFRLRLDDQKCEDALRGLVRAGLLDLNDEGIYRPHGWDKRQMPSDLDTTATERKRRERERKQATKPVTRDVTRDRGVTSRTSHGRSHGDVTRLDKERDTEKEREKTQTVKAPAAPSRPTPITNPLWDALVEGIGIAPKTTDERSRYGKAVKQLKEIDATPADVLAHCENYRATWPDLDLTVEALLRHWSRMDSPPPPRPVRGASGGGRRETVAEHNARVAREVFGDESDEVPGVIDVAWRSHEQDPHAQRDEVLVADLRRPAR